MLVWSDASGASCRHPGGAGAKHPRQPWRASIGLGLSGLTRENDKPRALLCHARTPSTVLPLDQDAAKIGRDPVDRSPRRHALEARGQARARRLRRQARNGAAADKADLMHGSAPLSSTSSEGDPLDFEDDEDGSIMREAALSVVASGIVSLADFEAVTGFRLPKNESTPVKDDDASSEAATDTSDDSCSIAGSELSEIVLDEEPITASSPKTNLFKRQSSSGPLQQPAARRKPTSSGKPARWVCVGYGRYVKVQE